MNAQTIAQRIATDAAKASSLRQASDEQVARFVKWNANTIHGNAGRWHLVNDAPVAQKYIDATCAALGRPTFPTFAVSA